MSAAASRALAEAPGAPDGVFVLCDGDLGGSARRSRAARCGGRGRRGRARRGGVRPARRRRASGSRAASRGWAIRRACGLETTAPISGQRALDRATLERVLPFADGFGMEMGMTIDAVRAGARVVEIELALSHRATGRTPAGFMHRARQLLDFARAYAAR